jgi:hypothetical protein
MAGPPDESNSNYGSEASSAITMEGAYAAHPQYLAQSPFFYYTPDPQADNRQHGHFSQQPHGLPYPPHHGMPGQEQVALYSPNGYQQRPSSASSQVQYHQQMQHHYGTQPLMTPVHSPQPMYQKPTIHVQQDSPYILQLDTDCYAPSTPPLSTSGSAVSSPPCTAEILPTPVNHTFYGQPGLEMMKGGCEEETFSEILTGDNWNNGVSPPMTPGTFLFFICCVQLDHDKMSWNKNVCSKMILSRI